jgi:arsenate reductase-like glutaredoxin family protein
MGLDRDELSDGQLLKMMIQEPRLVRRPLIQAEGELLVGTDKKAMAGVFG